MDANCDNCKHHEDLHDQTDIGEIYEDGCICKLNKTDFHYDNCLGLEHKQCLFFEPK